MGGTESTGRREEDEPIDLLKVSSATLEKKQKEEEGEADKKKKVYVDYGSRVDSLEHWDHLSFKSEASSFARCNVVKVIIDLQPSPKQKKPVTDLNQSKLYFLQSATFDYHYRFIACFIFTKKDYIGNEQFNATQYTSPNRRFYLLTISHYLDQKLYALEFWPGDSISLEKIRDIILKIESKSQWFSKSENRLRYRPNSTNQWNEVNKHSNNNNNKSSAALLAKLNIVTDSEMFGNIQYQPLTAGVAIGRLLFVDNSQLDGEQESQLFKSILSKSHSDEFDQHEILPLILLTKQIPNDLPNVSGLITSELQTPLCHVALLSQNRGTLNITIKNCFSSQELLQYKSQYVKIEADRHRYTITQLTDEQFNTERQAFKEERKSAAKRKIQVEVPEIKIDVKHLIELKDIKTSENVGCKAWQLAEMNNAKNIIKKWPQDDSIEWILIDGFVIPFYWYIRYSQSLFQDKDTETNTDEITVKDWVGNEMKQKTAKEDKQQQKQRDEVLEDIRSKIEAFEDSKDKEEEQMIEDVISRIQKFWTQEAEEEVKDEEKAVIFRSSTNVEDIPGFNGAGLYDSIVVKGLQNLTNKTVIKTTIGKVWSSLWSDRGVKERFILEGNNNNKVFIPGMAILVMKHKGYNSVLNGVALSRNPFRVGLDAIYVNAQIRGHLVTAGTKNELPEGWVIYDVEDGNGKNGTSEIVSVSSLVKEGQRIMQPTDLAFLAGHIQLLKMWFLGNLGFGKSGSNTIDIEFVICEEQEQGEKGNKSSNTKRVLYILQCRPFTMNLSF